MQTVDICVVVVSKYVTLLFPLGKNLHLVIDAYKDIPWPLIVQVCVHVGQFVGVRGVCADVCVLKWRQQPCAVSFTFEPLHYEHR